MCLRRVEFDPNSESQSLQRTIVSEISEEENNNKNHLTMNYIYEL